MDRLEVTQRLKDFGYEYNVDDEHSLEFAISKIMWTIVNLTNCEEIPEGLKYVGIDMACAEFLKIQKSFGKLTQIEFEGVAKSIAMGDTNITFADDASPEQKFDSAINYLLTGHNEEFLRYRKMVW